MNFLQRAEILIERGIPVIPVLPREKRCTLERWDQHATIDIAQIQAWHAACPRYNTGAVAKLDGHIIFDVDDAKVLENTLLSGIDLTAIRTLKVQGKKPAPLGHYYHLQTDASRALGNCDLRLMSRATGKKVSTLFDVKAHNGYVVGPGSIHPEGPTYEIVDHSDIVPIPDELTSWIAANKGAIWIGEGEYGPEKECGNDAGSSRPGNLDERVLDILSNRPQNYDPCNPTHYTAIKALIGKYGYQHRHEADLAIAVYLFFKYSGNAALVAAEFERVKLHEKRGRYEQTTLAAAEKCYRNYGRHSVPSVNEWPQPALLGTELKPVKELDLELLPAVFQPLIEDVSERMQVPPDFAAATTVVALAGCVNRRAEIQPKREDDSWRVVPNLWGAIISPPGFMKSPALNATIAPLRKIDGNWQAENRRAELQHASEVEEAKLKLQVWQEEYRRSIKKKEGLPVRPDDPPPAPGERMLLITDATPEKLQEILVANPAGVLVVRDELTGWLAELDRAGREGERAFYLEAWNGDSLASVHRIGRGTVYVPHACVSLLGSIQPARLQNYLVDALTHGPTDDGLIQRFQIMVYPDVKTDWTLVDRKPNQAAIAIVERVFCQLAELQSVAPLLLRFDNDAQDLFEEWWAELETVVRSGIKNGVEQLHPAMVSHLSKYRSLMPTIAGLFELADRASAGENLLATPPLINLIHAQQAAAYCDYLESHAARVYSSLMSPTKLAAQNLAKHIQGGRLPPLFTARDIYVKDWRGLDTPDGVNAALEVLEQYAWLRSEEISSGARGGRPTRMWRVNPRLEVRHAK